MSQERGAGGIEIATVSGAVVVGNDRSEGALAATEWALADAERRGVRLVVLRAWSITSAPRPTGSEHGYVPSEDEFAEAVRAEMASDLASVIEGGRVEITLMPAHCPADDALVEASKHAALIVVGARGHGLARWLGSVSTAVVRASHGPVTVIPGRGERGAD